MLSKKLEIISVLFILAVIVIPYAYAATEKFEVAPSTIVSKYFYLEKGYVMSWNTTLSGIVSEDNPTLDIKIFTPNGTKVFSKVCKPTTCGSGTITAEEYGDYK